nr:DUF2530 domain-containing protein [Allosalinactinospora lopnorensis]
MESDYRVPTALGTAAWTVALVVFIAMGDRLDESDRWWLWVCLMGIALGLFGFLYIPRLLRKHDEAERKHLAKMQGERNGAAEPGPERPGQGEEAGQSFRGDGD